MDLRRSGPVDRGGWTRTLVVMCWALAAACGKTDDGAAADTGVVVTDSAGVRLVDLGVLSDLDLTERPTSVSGEIGRAGGTELFRVSVARLLESGVLAVGNAGTFEVLYFARDGSLIRRAGGEGDGPGEFRDITAFPGGVGDALVVYDVRQGRLTELDSAGGVVRTRSLPSPSNVVDLLPLTAGAGGRVVAVHGDARIFAQSGVRRDTVPLMVIDSSLAVDTIGLWPGKQWSFASTPQGSFRTEVAFGYTAEASGRSGRAVIGSTDRLELTVVSADGDPVMRIRSEEPVRRVSDDDVRRWREARLAGVPADFPAMIREAIETGPHNDVFPAFSGLLLDGDHRIWIGEAIGDGAPERAWTVLDADGRPAFRVALPAAAAPLDAVGDRVVVLSRSDLGEEVIAVLALGPAE